MYKNVQGPHSPLSPLPPMDFNLKLSHSNGVIKGRYLTPANSKRNIHMRRSFTPLINITPPSASPIKPKINDTIGDASTLVINDSAESGNDYMTPQQKLAKLVNGRTFTIGRKSTK